MVQIPIGLSDEHNGAVDLITMKAYYFDGDNGEHIAVGEIPADLVELAEEQREIMLDAISGAIPDDEFQEDS